MSAVRGIYRNGAVTLSATPDWPEECEVVIEPAAAPSIGIAEEDWDDSPEGVAEWLRWYDSLEPLEFTAAEEAAAGEWDRRQKEHDLAKTMVPATDQCLNGGRRSTNAVARKNPGRRS